MQRSYVIFSVDSHQYAISLDLVEEFDSGIGVTHVEGAVAEIAGLATRRGQLLTLLDLRAVLFARGGSNRVDAELSSKSILLDLSQFRRSPERDMQKIAASDLALQVDSVDAIQNFSTENLASPTDEMRSRHIEFLCTHEGRIVHFLSIESMLKKIYRKGHEK